MNYVDGRKGVKVKNKFYMQPFKLGLKDEDDNEVIWHGAYKFWVFKVDTEVGI
jgi:hypothetical protein